MKYLIWSNEHGAWWRAAKLGYTTVIADAGRYDEQEARTICDDANRYLPAGAQPNEVMVPAPEVLSDLQGKAERLCGCSSTQAFLALSDEQKAQWFVTTGQRDKWARERIEQLEVVLSDALREFGRWENGYVYDAHGEERNVERRIRAALSKPKETKREPH